MAGLSLYGPRVGPADQGSKLVQRKGWHLPPFSTAKQWPPCVVIQLVNLEHHFPCVFQFFLCVVNFVQKFEFHSASLLLFS